MHSYGSYGASDRCYWETLWFVVFSDLNQKCEREFYYYSSGPLLSAPYCAALTFSTGRGSHLLYRPGGHPSWSR